MRESPSVFQNFLKNGKKKCYSLVPVVPSREVTVHELLYFNTSLVISCVVFPLNKGRHFNVASHRDRGQDRCNHDLNFSGERENT